MPVIEEIPPRGVLNVVQMGELIDQALLDAEYDLADDASAIDMHIGDTCWVANASIKQVENQGDTVEAVLAAQNAERLPVSDAGMVVEPHRVYVFKLKERIDLRERPWLRARATGKSSVGRLDVLTRIMVDGSPSYDEIPLGYEGALFLEVIPSTFPIRFRPGDSLAQLRFFSGRPEDCVIRDVADRRLLYDGAAVAFEQQMRGHLTVDLTPAPNCEAPTLRAILNAPEIDWARAVESPIDPRGFFEPVDGEPERGLLLEKDRFYILRSRERLSLPRDIAVTGYAYTESLGELRIHYAGFAHPYFGTSRRDGRTGTPLIFEVRAHTVNVILRHGEVLANIRFYSMSKPAAKPASVAYGDQELKLSKVFRDLTPDEWRTRKA